MIKALCLCCAVLVGCGGKLAPDFTEVEVSIMDDGGVIVIDQSPDADVPAAAKGDEPMINDCVSNPMSGNCDCWPACSQLPIDFNGKSGYGHTYQ